MNVLGGTIAKLVATVTAGVLLASCSDEPKGTNPASPNGVPAVSTVAVPGLVASVAPSGAVQMVESPYDVRLLVGATPAKMPVWSAKTYNQAAAEEYSRQVLLFLVAANRKAGVNIPPLTYAFYDITKHSGKPGCIDENRTFFEPKLGDGVGTCTWGQGQPTGLLVNPRALVAADPWSKTLATRQDDPLHGLLYILSSIADGTYEEQTTGNHLRRRICLQALGYKGVTLMQPELESKVQVFLEPPLDNPATQTPSVDDWRYDFYFSGCATRLVLK